MSLAQPPVPTCPRTRHRWWAMKNASLTTFLVMLTAGCMVVGWLTTFGSPVQIGLAGAH